MKERPLLHLTLDNLECEAAKDYAYVLTSPRSLEACKVMGVKPVELLYRSVREVREQLHVTTSLDRVIAVYHSQEKHRRRKLEACRAVRDRLIAHSDLSSSPDSTLKENRDPSPIISKRSPSPKVLNIPKRSPSPSFAKRESSPVFSCVITRKDQLNRENAARARSANSGYEALRAVENKTWDLPNNKFSSGKSVIIPRAALPSVSITPPAPSNKPKVKSRRVLTRSRPNSGTPLPSVGSTARSTPESSAWRPKSSGSSSSAATRTASRRIGSATSTSAFSGRSSPGRSSRVRICPRSWEGQPDRNNNSGKRSSSARRQLNFTYWPPEGLNVPEHDRRILESMAMKREAERAAEELAHEAHIAWEQARQDREQEQLEQTSRWREHVAEKRRVEGELNERKMAELREEEERAQQRLQQSLAEKDARSAALLRSADQRKYDEQGDRAGAVERQRAAVLYAREQLQHESSVWRISVLHRQSARLQRAEMTRVQARDHYRRRVASANRVEEMRRSERRHALQAEAEESLRLLRVQCREKEERAQNLLERASGERERQLRGASEARAQREQNAHQLHAELEAGLERWRVQCATLQREAAVKAEARALQQNKERQQRAEAANRAREEHHNLLMTRVSAEQRALEEARRSAILAKEDKMRRLQIRRELAVHESRAQAHTTAELREQIRRTMSPETFDRLVARTALEVRVTASRPNTASPPATRSHILLG